MNYTSQSFYTNETNFIVFFYVLLTVHLSIILVINQLNAQNLVFLISLLYASTFFEHYVLIIRRSKLCYTASVIVTPCRWPSGAQVERGLCTGRPPTECDDTRCCIIQFWPPDDEHMMLETCRGIKWTSYKRRFCALSWLITKIRFIALALNAVCSHGFLVMVN